MNIELFLLDAMIAPIAIAWAALVAGAMLAAALSR
jgi:hypothetical protein